jgi:threonine/homoserine/homoserine lactone efflux protein
LAVTGSSTIINILTGYTYIFKILGGIFLVYLGWTLLSKKNTEVKETPDLKSKIKDFGSVYLLTLSNPSTILVFMSLIFTMQSMVKTAGSFLVVLGIFTGSILWWLFLVTLVFLSKSKLKPNQIDFISRLGGVALILFGIFSSIF